MIRGLSSFLFLLLSFNQVPVRETNGREYLIAGQNTVQRIYFETSSSFSENHTGRFALDSDNDTVWTSSNGNGPHWIEIDFGVKRIMSMLVIHLGRKDGYWTVRRFKVQFLHNNRWFDFTTINCEDRGFFGGVSYRPRVEIDLGGLDASTFRILIPEGATYRGHAAIAEIETYIGSAKIRYFDDRLKGLCFPVENGFLPDNDKSYPNSPRSYRGGKHVGLDIFHYHKEGSYTPIPVDKNTPIIAADDGVIIRADTKYEPMTPTEWKMRSKFFQKNPRTFVLRSFGGRQVWIDHKNGIVTTYNHLSKLDSGIVKGAKVSKGERIGWAGNSGLWGEAVGKNYGIHLHFEIWVDSYYLGYGMKLPEIKKYVRWIFFDLQ